MLQATEGPTEQFKADASPSNHLQRKKARTDTCKRPPTYAFGNTSFSSKEDGSIRQIDTYSAQTRRHVMKGKIDPIAGGQLTEEL